MILRERQSQYTSESFGSPGLVPLLSSSTTFVAERVDYLMQ